MKIGWSSDDRSIMKRAQAKYGYALQQIVAIEEMAELSKEISKVLSGAHTREALLDGIADVYIMLEQLTIIHGIQYTDISYTIDAKLQQVYDRIEEENT